MDMSGSDRQSPEHLECKASYYGWRVALASGLSVMVGFGSLFVYTFSVFVKPLAGEFGWSREATSRGFAIAALTVAFSAPVLGRWLDRYGPRRVLFPCILIFGLSITSFAFLHSHLWQFYLVCFLLGAVGNGTTQMGYAQAVSSWFSKRLGMALALVVAGNGLGAVVLPFLAQTLIAGPGWRAAYLTLGVLVLVQSLPLTWRYLHECERCETHVGAAKPGTNWQQALRSMPFWIIVAVLFVGSVALNGAITQMVALLTDRGISGRTAALCASTLGGFSLASRLAVGWLLDRFAGPRVAFFVTIVAAGGVLLLARLTTVPAACLAASLIGVGLGAEADITPYLLTRYYGLGSFSTLYGLTFMFYAIAGAAGPVILGRAYDITGSYAALLTILALAMAVAASLMLLMPRYPVPTGNLVDPDSRVLISEAQ
jgi:MFS family permease